MLICANTMEAATDDGLWMQLIVIESPKEAATDAMICESWTSWKAPRLFQYGPCLSCWVTCGAELCSACWLYHACICWRRACGIS